MTGMLSKAMKIAPMGTLGVAMLGLEYAPKFTTSMALALGANSLMNWASNQEERQFNTALHILMMETGPWKFGMPTAMRCRELLQRLPNDRIGSILIDPYYFDHRMVYTDDSYGEGHMRLFSYAFRLRPCAVFALNYDPRQDEPSPLTESVICVAFLRGTDMAGRSLLFFAMWQEGLPLGGNCLFGIPRWGQLRLCDDDDSQSSVWKMFSGLLNEVKLTGVSEQFQIDEARDCMGETKNLPTAVERGFPNLQNTIWFGTAPFPSMDFELQLLGADYRQREVSVPEWFRSGRGVLG